MPSLRGFPCIFLVDRTGNYFDGTGNSVSRTGNLVRKIRNRRRMRFSVHTGIVLLTSRISVEMVQKTAVLGTSILVAVSAPTALAVRVAESCGMTLVAIARGQDFEIFSHPQRIAVLAP